MRAIDLGKQDPLSLDSLWHIPRIFANYICLGGFSAYTGENRCARTKTFRSIGVILLGLL